jgi:hypothetical protein
MWIETPKFVEEIDNKPTINEDLVFDNWGSDLIIQKIEERISNHPEMLDSPEEMAKINELIQSAIDSFDPVDWITKEYSNILNQIKWEIKKEPLVVKNIVKSTGIKWKSHAQTWLYALMNINDRYDLDKNWG